MIFKNIIKIYFNNLIREIMLKYFIILMGMGIGDWGLGIWAWGFGAQTPNPKTQNHKPKNKNPKKIKKNF